MSWAGSDDVFLSTSLASYLDKKLLVLLRDGRKLLGILRSFDQFANAVLEGACERVIVGDLYSDIPLGLYVIRGENVVLIGELDLDMEELPAHMICVSAAEIRRHLSNSSTEGRKGCHRSQRLYEEENGVS
ncbi:sm-like protein LSM1B isoform X1 [Ananas comosus]|uniref:U6 snRNA-associated Sm-like protein LSm1 n=1 Tax=Ananas comosus TaxID=4615 RepID=A0A6P5FCB4_ANACO|nr:sm-like protein LSM1B isoform X1 [Ananas comosus]XP_020093255.1 sm-like protein LSM1B isoform X1 [Ananas comosus]